ANYVPKRGKSSGKCGIKDFFPVIQKLTQSQDEEISWQAKYLVKNFEDHVGIGFKSRQTKVYPDPGERMNAVVASFSAIQNLLRDSFSFLSLA
ncbi:hypothetical protein, partial [uncultured Gimesia sp.]|uniref:hypothetical protein n=1 Tax=uncultured Gimesia sp. TaxID=1678688 RepID=UPI00260E0B03